MGFSLTHVPLRLNVDQYGMGLGSRLHRVSGAVAAGLPAAVREARTADGVVRRLRRFARSFTGAPICYTLPVRLTPAPAMQRHSAISHAQSVIEIEADAVAAALRPHPPQFQSPIARRSWRCSAAAHVPGLPEPAESSKATPP